MYVSFKGLTLYALGTIYNPHFTDKDIKTLIHE
jgi:hypothetical protein